MKNTSLVISLTMLSFMGLACSDNHDTVDDDLDFVRWPVHETEIFGKLWSSQLYEWEELEFYNIGQQNEKRTLNKYIISRCESEIQNGIIITLHKNGQDTKIEMLRSDEIIPLSVTFSPLNSNIKSEIYNFSNWDCIYPKLEGIKYNGFEIFEDNHLESFSFQEPIPNGIMFDAHEQYPYIEYTNYCRFHEYFDYNRVETKFAAYRNEDGDLRIKFLGIMEGKYGRIPIIDHRSPIPDRVVVVKIPDIYEHPDYDELVKGAERAYLNTTEE